MADAADPADRSWAGPVVVVLVLVLGVVAFVALGGQFASGPGTTTTSPVACACEPPPPSDTPRPDHVRAAAHVSADDGALTVGFADNRNAAALLVVVAPDASALPANATAWTNGTPRVTDTAPGNATFLNGSVTVAEVHGAVRATDRGLLLTREGAGVDLAVTGDAYVGVLALPPADSDLEATVVGEWTGSE